MTKFEAFMFHLRYNVPEGYRYVPYTSTGCTLEYRDSVYDVTISIIDGIGISVLMISNISYEEICYDHFPTVDDALGYVEQVKQKYDAANAFKILVRLIREPFFYWYKTKEMFYKYYKYLNDGNEIDNLIQICIEREDMNGEFVAALLHKKWEIDGFSGPEDLKL